MFQKIKSNKSTIYIWRKRVASKCVEFTTGFCGPYFRYYRAFGSGDTPDETYGMLVLSIGYGCLYVPVPTKFVRSAKHNYEDPTYGFAFLPYNNSHVDSLWIYLGYRSKVVELPWSMNWVRTSYLLKDGTWYEETESKRRELKADVLNYFDNPDAWNETYDYTYVLNSGEIQRRTAKVYVVEREWRPKWFKWTRLFNKVRRCIEVKFNDEVGEDTGSWKGGAVGCGYDMREIQAFDEDSGCRIKRMETPLECLRRMESERKL